MMKSWYGKVECRRLEERSHTMECSETLVNMHLATCEVKASERELQLTFTSLRVYR